MNYIKVMIMAYFSFLQYFDYKFSVNASSVDENTGYNDDSL